MMAIRSAISPKLFRRLRNRRVRHARDRRSSGDNRRHRIDRRPTPDQDGLGCRRAHVQAEDTAISLSPCPWGRPELHHGLRIPQGRQVEERNPLRLEQSTDSPGTVACRFPKPRGRNPGPRNRGPPREPYRWDFLCR